MKYTLIADLLPPDGSSGGQWRDHRQVLNGIFWILHTGAQWRELPERYGPRKTVYGRFNRWRREGLFDRMPQRVCRSDSMSRAGSTGTCGASRARPSAPAARPPPAAKRGPR